MCNQLLAQEWGYEPYNLEAHIYKKNKVKRCTIINTTYQAGKEVEEFVGTIEHYDINGNIILEREYFGMDTSDVWHCIYEYDDNNRMTSEVWKMLDENEVDRFEYFYNADGKRVKECDYIKYGRDGKYEPEGCHHIHRKDGKIVLVTKDDGSTFYRYEHRGNISYQYDENDSLKSEYINGVAAMYRYYDAKGSHSEYRYVRNEYGDVTQSVTTRDGKEKVREFKLEYQNGLLIKRTVYEDGKLSGKDVYRYVRYE